MNKLCMQLYNSMMDDMNACRLKQLEFTQEIECCFHISKTYWEIIRKRLMKYEFQSPCEEIQFFKNIKPKFTSEIEYYNLLYHAELFKPDYGIIEENHFWIRESHRLDKYISENKHFYEYYKSGHTERDHELFIRQQSELGAYLEPRGYDTDNKSATTHDHLVGQLIALERYHQYVQTQL